MQPFREYALRLTTLVAYLALATAMANASTAFDEASPNGATRPAQSATSHTYTVIAQIPPDLSVSNLVALNGTFFGPASPASGKGPSTLVEIRLSGAVRVIHTFGDELGEADWLSADPTNNTLYGVSKNGARGNGFIFSKVPGGIYRHVYDFPYNPLYGHGHPEGPVLAINGTLYGTCDDGFYIIPPSGSFILIPTAGGPYGNLVALNGTIYANTSYGGEGSGDAFPSVVALGPAGTLTTAWSWHAGNPSGLNDLVALGGALYGTSYTSLYGNSMVFALNPLNGQMNVLHTFNTASDGDPEIFSGVAVANGSLYGTTQTIIYEITPSGTWNVIHTFADPTYNGVAYSETLTISNGLLYGLSYDTNKTESVFSITP